MKILKLIVDVLMFVITLLLMSINITGNLIHEILGITLTILIFCHLILNFKWLKSVTLNFKKVKTKTKILYFINIFTFIIYFTTIALGISISNELFHFNIGSLITLRFFHHILGRLATIIMFAHVGFHLEQMTIKTKDPTIRGIIYIAYITLAIVIAMILTYTLVNSYVWDGIM